MSARVSAFARDRRRQVSDAPPAVDEALEAAQRIESAAQEIRTLNAILQQIDKNITAAAKRAVKRAGSWPLRLNSRQAKRSF